MQNINRYLIIFLSIATISLASICVTHTFLNNSKNKLMNNKSYVIRKSSDRGYFDHGWLKTYHTFSFASYYDPRFMGYRNLRVINEDTIAPEKGFGTHSHDNMEIITVLLSGELAHKDSMGNESIIHEHEIQVMSAGSGVQHSEYNPSKTKFSHLLQIWITPNKQNVKPRYQQIKFPEKNNEWVLLVSETGEHHSLPIHQSVKLYMLTLTPDTKISKTLEVNRYGWIQIIEGSISFNGELFRSGDGVALNKAAHFEIKAIEKTKLLFFDLN